MKVCTFEPAVGCQARSGAKLSTSSLLFDRAILFMSPSANYRLDGTVTQYDARDKLVIHRDEPYTHWHAANTGLTFRSHATTQRMLILRRGNGCNRRDFFGNRQSIRFFRQSPIYLFRLSELSVPRFGTGKETTRSRVIMRNKICSIGRSKGGCYG
jgi:hypothetical protein